MYDTLLSQFTMEEIWLALYHMELLKSSGPDDFSACFYQSY